MLESDLCVSNSMCHKLRIPQDPTLLFAQFHFLLITLTLHKKLAARFCPFLRNKYVKRQLKPESYAGKLKSQYVVICYIYFRLVIFLIPVFYYVFFSEVA